MSWSYKDKPFTEPENWFGFVYLITNLTNDHKYIGKKFFTKAGYKRKKGKRKKIRIKNDWESYFGSNERLLQDVKKLGKDKFKREILVLCKTRSECTYWESKFIFEHDALIKNNYYNDWVQCKIRRAHLGTLIKK